jgi:hypothetical protein
MRVLVLAVLAFGLLVTANWACESENEPLTAEMRFIIDSTSNAQTRIRKKEIDSLCTLNSAQVLPGLVDSIMRLRKQQMQEKLKPIKE